MIRFVDSRPILRTLYDTAIPYPAPLNLNYFWNFGYYSLICLISQILTGLFLAMHYVPDVDLAFSSIEHLVRDVNNGWFIRISHANGASMFFIVVYIHMFRGLYYGSYLDPRRLLWSTGVIILLLMIATAFLGYVLPWGQMSFWAATVITNLFSAIPYFGESIVIWLWGGFSVGKATLTRFFSLHFLLPFVLTALVVAHLIILHESGSNNPLGIIHYKISEVAFIPHFTFKDAFGMNIFFVFFSLFVFFMPNKLGHPDNFIEANPMVTPTHIVPEWYFLPLYAILRSIPDKLLGVIMLLFAILALLLIPVFFSFSSTRSLEFHPLSKYLFWTIVGDVILLGWLGSSPVEYPYVFLGQILTFYYFFYFLLLAPLSFAIERFIWNYEFVEVYDELTCNK